MTSDQLDILTAFTKNEKFSGKAKLSIALIVTQHARRLLLPLDPDALLTNAGGQVLGTGGPAVQSILARHGISKVLAAEGGRTSRGSIDTMRKYVVLLNELEAMSPIDLDAVEAFWIARVQEFFAAKPLKVRLDTSHRLRTLVRDILAQAYERQRASPGMQYAGAVMQHLVGAKLDCALGPGSFAHNSFSTSDAQSRRAGDFLIGDVSIHVTTAPGEAVVRRCRKNLDDGLHPVVVTTAKGVGAAELHSDAAGLSDRIDIFEIEQFVALNLYELGRFAGEGRPMAVIDLVSGYNQVIDEVETDPSLKIEFRT
jgi:hypothetical protein